MRLDLKGHSICKLHMKSTCCGQYFHGTLLRFEICSGLFRKSYLLLFPRTDDERSVCLVINILFLFKWDSKRSSIGGFREHFLALLHLIIRSNDPFRSWLFPLVAMGPNWNLNPFGNVPLHTPHLPQHHHKVAKHYRMHLSEWILYTGLGVQ